MASGFFTPNSRGRAKVRSFVNGAGNRDSLFRRSVFLMSVITMLLSGCVLRLAYLQIIQGHYNKVLADQNRIRPIPIPAARGNVFDRKGKLFASNQLSHGVYLWPRQQTKEEWKDTVERLSPILKMPANVILQRLEKAGYNSLMPIVISQNIDSDAFIAFAEQEGQFKGVEVFSGTTRSYNKDKLASHVIGYIGEATPEDVKKHPEYPSGMIVGLTGIERIANDALVGTWGRRLVEVDAGGKETRLLGNNPAVSGTDIKLTMDLAMQRAAEKGLAGKRGAVVALDVRTGGILVMASAPTYDPGIFTRQVSSADWKRLEGVGEPLLNRALQGYPPGSTFKVVTSVAGMESGHYGPDSKIMTSGSISLGGYSFHEHGGSGYGLIGFKEALTFSSNTFYYQIGLKVGPEEISKWGKIMGIGSSDELGLAGASPGMIPTPAEKEKLFGEPWYGGDTVSTSIGQGLVQATPLELATMVGVVATGGMRLHPHFLESQSETMKPTPTGIKPENLQAIARGLIGAVQEGTARSLNDGSVPLSAGKTGTAEVLGQTSNAMYVGYAPADKPEIAIAVVVENGGYGGVAAVPIAKEVYKAYFGDQKPAKPQN
jgi:penicillin-binding protein 2